MRTPEGDRALMDGREAIMALTESLINGAAQSGDPILFYAGAVAALMGQVAAALGGQAADEMMEFMRPLLAQEVRKREAEKAH